MKTFAPAISACVILALLAAAGCAGRRLAERRKLELHIEKIRENNKQACRAGCLAFDGDSNFELINFQEYFTAPACNYAIRGSTTEDLLKRKERLFNLKPESIVVLVGGNDLIKSTPIPKIEEHYIRLLQYYKSFCKNVYCISNLPVHAQLSVKNIELKKINAILRGLCGKQGVVFVNVYPSLLKNGALNPDYAMDPVHLNKAGQEVLVGILKKYLGK